jgi:hypothetical protein
MINILVAGLNYAKIAALKELLGAVFDVRNLGEAMCFLGMEVSRDRKARTLKLTQKKLMEDLLARHEREAAINKSVLINPGEKLVRDGEPLDREKVPYNELVGSLLYLSVCTRSDIAQTVEVLARYMSVLEICPHAQRHSHKLQLNIYQ